MEAIHGHRACIIFYAPGWAQIDNPKFTYKDGLYTVELPAATSDQWQSQMAFETDLTASLSDTYNFYCVLNSSEDHPGVTVKLTETDEKNEAGETIKSTMTTSSSLIV